MNIFCSLIVSLIIALISYAGQGFSDPVNYQKQAEMEFARQNYDQAIVNYRQYLRRNPKDYDTWNFLAASYYHTGLPEKALSYLKQVNAQSKLKSYNHYYQGLCYLALDLPGNAKVQLTKAAKFHDEFGAQAMFELAVYYYRQQNSDMTRQWALSYIQGFPQGPMVQRAQRLLDNSEKKIWDENIEGALKPDMAAALYRYSPLSLMREPHYWFMQLGYRVEQGTVFNPARDNATGLPTVRAEPYGEHNVLVNAGFGLGPISSQNATTYVGYHYYQKWGADPDRMSTFFRNPNFNTFPFRPDLLTRYHQLFSKMQKYTNKYTNLGLIATYEVAKVGSSFIRTASETELNRVLNVSNTSLLRPWYGVDINENVELAFYVFLRKELNFEAQELSNKSYNFLYDSAEKTLSFGLEQHYKIPSANLRFDLDVFRYDYIYNDYWLDFSRVGFTGKSRWELNHQWTALFGLGFMRDQYTLEQLRSNACSYDLADQANGSENPSIKVCPRIDQTMLYSLGAAWHLSPNRSLIGTYTNVTTTNRTMKVFNRARQEILFTFNFAFPGGAEDSSLWNRMGDDDVMNKVR